MASIIISRASLRCLKLAFALLLVSLIIFVATDFDSDASTTVGYYKQSFQEYVDTYIIPYTGSSETGDDSGVDPDLEGVELDFDNLESNASDEEYEHDMFADKENLADNQMNENVAGFFADLFHSIENHSPLTKSDKAYSDDCPLHGDIGTRPDNYKDWNKLTEDSLGNCLELSRDEVEFLRINHAAFVQDLKSMDIQELTTNKEMSEDRGINSYYRGDGIVMVGGDKYTLLSFLSIKTLRSFNTTLPVEVFIPGGESYDTEFCHTLLPRFNAKCIYLTDILDKETIEMQQFKGYQYKSLAILTSSFANVLLVDADNFPITNLDDVFHADIYKERGLILWPDFWRRTTAPKFYDVIDVPVNTNKRVRNSVDDVSPMEMYDNAKNDLENIPFHDFQGALPDMSTESGQIMINKRKHLKTVLLSLYYNFNGPNWYYSIFSQRAAGEGDKETFIAAAHYFNLPYYQVKTGPGVDGYRKPENDDYRGVGILQHNFIQDNERHMKAIADFKKSKHGPFTADQVEKYTLDTFYSHYFEGDSTKEVDIMFIHANYPKFDPVSLYQGRDFMHNGEHLRSYSNLKRINNFDLELNVYTTLNEYVCRERIYFPFLLHALDDNEDEYSGMCAWISSRLDFLERTHEKAVSSN